MTIMFLTSGRHAPAPRFRVVPYVPQLEARGHRCRVAPSFPDKYDQLPAIGFRLNQRVKRLTRHYHLCEARLKRYDVVYLERELFDSPDDSLDVKFRDVAPFLVLDIDDAVFLRYPDKFERLVPMADLVIAGNQLLADYLRPRARRVVVIPSCVELRAYPAKIPRDGRCVVGWMGTSSNMPNIELVAPALRRLAGRHDFELRIVSNDDNPLEQLDLSGVDVRFRRWRAQTEVAELTEFDIGLMPLHDTQWNRYKCGLKLIQYMGVGIPGVASPVGVNTEIVESGTSGLLAADDDAWERSLGELVADPQRRARIGAAGREVVRQRYSIEANVDALEAALTAGAKGVA